MIKKNNTKNIDLNTWWRELKEINIKICGQYTHTVLISRDILYKWFYTVREEYFRIKSLKGFKKKAQSWKGNVS